MLFEKKNQPLGMLSGFRIVYMQIPAGLKQKLPLCGAPWGESTEIASSISVL